MNQQATKGSPELWLNAAYQTLITSGIDSVRIASLATQLNLSRASFYWFFNDRDALLDGLLDLWRKKNTGSLIQRCNAYADTIVEAMLNVTDCWYHREMFDSKLEYAIRSWAIQSPELQEELITADDSRINAIKEMLIRFNMPEGMAEVRARAIYLIQIGYISAHVTEDMDTRMKRIPEYIAMYTEVYPEPHDLARFFDRIGYVPKDED